MSGKRECTLALVMLVGSMWWARGAMAAQPDVAIVHGRLLTITNGVIENGTLVMSEGKIVAVGGPSTAVPPHATVVDATGMTIYPGLVDAVNYDGVSSGSISEARARHHPYSAGTPVPEVSVANAIRPVDTILNDRLNGLLNAGVSPGTDGPEPGQLAFIQYTDRQESMVLAANGALVMNFGKGSERKGMYPSTAFGVADFFREQLTRLQEYRSGLGLHSSDGKQIADARLDALIPFIEGKRPIVVYASDDDEIGVALDLSEEFGLHVMLAGATHLDLEMDRVVAAKIPVIFGPIWDLPVDGARFDRTFTLPARLHARGVKVAIATFGADAGGARNLPYAAGYAAAYGLPYEEALKSITLNAAEMFGFGQTIGSLEVGKTANVVVATGDPLDVSTDVKRVFLAGAAIQMKSPQTALRDRFQRRPAR